MTNPESTWASQIDEDSPMISHVPAGLAGRCDLLGQGAVAPDWPGVSQTAIAQKSRIHVVTAQLDHVERKYDHGGHAVVWYSPETLHGHLSTLLSSFELLQYRLCVLNTRPMSFGSSVRGTTLG